MYFVCKAILVSIRKAYFKNKDVHEGQEQFYVIITKFFECA